MCGEDGVDDRRKDGLDGVGVDGADKSQNSFLGGFLDRGHLVANGGQSGTQKSDEVRLDSRRHGGMLSDCADSVNGTLTDSGIFFVGELFLQ